MWTWFFWGQWKKKKKMLRLLMDIVIGTIRWIIDHQEVRDHLSVISFEQDVYQSHWKREKKNPLFRYFQSPKNDSIHWIWDKGKGGGATILSFLVTWLDWTCHYEIEHKWLKPVWMLSLENMCVELVRPTLLGLQQDVDTASISILDRMLQKVALGQLSVYIKKKMLCSSMVC